MLISFSSFGKITEETSERDDEMYTEEEAYPIFVQKKKKEIQHFVRRLVINREINQEINQIFRFSSLLTG